jgi:hypothetical protein
MFKNKSNIKPSLGSTINTNHPLAQGLVGCWLFNEQTGNKIYDLSKDNHMGFFNGADWKYYNNSVKLDGTNDFIQTSKNLDLTGNAPRSICIWFYIETMQTKNLCGYGIGSGGQIFDIILWNDGGGYNRVIGHYWGGGNDTIGTLPSRNTIKVPGWNQVVHIYDGTTVSIFTNGVFSNSKVLNLNTANSTFNIGKGTYEPYDYFGGDISQASIYNRALSSEEVLSLYEQPYQFIDPPAALKYYSYSQHRSLAAPSIKSEENVNILANANINKKYVNVVSQNRKIKDLNFDGSLQVTKYKKLDTPKNLSIQIIGASGSTTYSYKITALNEYGETLASNAITTNTGNGTLSSSNFTRIFWDWVPKATSYKVYGRSNNSYLLITQTIYNHFDDTGIYTPSGSLPSINSTGYDYRKLNLSEDMNQYKGNNIADNYIKIYDFSLIRPMYDLTIIGQNTYLRAYDVIEWSDDINYLFGVREGTTNPRKLCLYKHYKTSNSFTYVGEINIPGDSILNFKAIIYRYTIGTVSGSGSTITGNGTSWKTDNFALNSRIGFFTNQAHLVDKWYQISAMPSDTSLTLSSNLDSNIPENSLYIMEEIRIVFQSSVALYQIKGISELDFITQKSFLNNNFSIPNNFGLYSLKTLSGRSYIGLCVPPLESWTSHKVYALYYINSTTRIGIDVVNLRLNQTASTQFFSGLAEYNYGGYFNDNPNFFDTNAGSFFQLTTNINYPGADYGSTYSKQWLGNITIPTTGTYTFYCTSDDASFMWIGASATSGYTTGNALVQNPGLHGMQEKSGTISLTAGQTYDIRIQFGENFGGDGMIFEYSGPGISRTSSLTALNPLSYVTSLSPSPYLFSCGEQYAIGNISLSLMNGTYATVKHGHYKNTPCFMFANTFNKVYMIKESDIYSGNINLFDHKNNFANASHNHINYSFYTDQILNFDYDTKLDRVIYPPNSYYSFKGYIGYVENATIYHDSYFYNSCGVYNPLVKNTNYEEAIQDPSFYVKSVNGWAYFGRLDSIRSQNTIFAVPIKSHWVFAEQLDDYTITPIMYFPRTAILKKVNINNNLIYGDSPNGVTPEPIRIYARTYGIEDNSGKWTLIKNGDLTVIQSTEQIQFRIDSSIFLHFGKTRKIYGISVEYEYKDTIAKEFAWNSSDSNFENGTVGFIQKELCKSNPSFTIKYYNKENSKLYFSQSSDRSLSGEFEYYSGGWLKGFGPNQVGLRRRFIPSTVLQKNLEYEIELEVR